MTRERARTLQTATTVTATQTLRGTVTAISSSTVTVLLVTGSTVVGVRVAGCSYSVGATVFVLMQEPAVGPVIPAGSAPSITTAGGSIDFTGTTCSYVTTPNNTTDILRTGDAVTVNTYINLGSNAAMAGTVVGKVSAGFRPTAPRAEVWTFGSAATWRGTAGVEVVADGTITVRWVSSMLVSGDILFGSISYRGA